MFHRGVAFFLVIFAVFLRENYVQAAGNGGEGIINTEVTQSFDISTSVVRMTADIKAANVRDTYDLFLPTQWAEKMAFMSVSSNKNKILTTLPPAAVSRGDNFTVYTILTGLSPSAEPAQVSLRVSAVFTGLLQPWPEEIFQSENQLVKLRHGSHYFYSAYPTTTQKSVYKLPPGGGVQSGAGAQVESFTKVSPYAIRGNVLNFGPFKDLAPYSSSPLEIHFVNNFPFAKFSSVVREIEVSHWGK